MTDDSQDAARLVHDARGPLAVVRLEVQNLRAIRQRLGGADPAVLLRMDQILDNLEVTAVRGLAAIDAIASSLAISAPPANAPRRHAAPGTTVLIVDDEPALRRALERRLAPRWTTVTASSVAEAARRLADRDDIAAVLCDVHLPDGDLRKLLDWMLSHRSELVGRTIGMTGGPVQLEGYPAIAWARKPDDMTRIAWFVEQALGQS